MDHRAKARKRTKRSSTPVPARSGNAESNEQLLDPTVREAIWRARAGVTFKQGSSELKIQWAPQTLDRLAEWLRQGASCQTLSQIIARNPDVLGHPFVYRQIQHLRHLRRVAEDADEGLVGEGEYIPTAQEQREIEQALKDIATAWVNYVVGYGWTLAPRKKRRGRPVRKREDDEWNVRLLTEYEEVLSELKKHQIRHTSGELQSQWHARLCGIVQKVWQGSMVSQEWHTEPPPPWPRGFDWRKARTVFTTIPLPREQVKEWVERISEAASEGPMRDRLAYNLVGFRHRLSEGQVRGVIQAARRAFPGFSPPR